MFDFKNFAIRLTKFTGLLFILVASFFVVTTSIFTFLMTNNVEYAFDGAYGAGAYAKGGRNGLVYHVTTLEDNNSVGSLRYALEQKQPRTIVFDVAGVIDLKSPIVVKNGFVTVAGQTAPGDGICIKGNSIDFQCNDVIIRYLHFRFGVKDRPASLIVKNQNNIIIDHCSFAWGNPTNLDFYDNTNSTLQWSIIAEAYGDYGARIGGNDVSIHHNFFVNNKIGNPYFYQERMSLIDDVRLDFRNNVLYNWSNQSVHGVKLGQYNLADNYYKFGDITIVPVRSQIVNTEENNKVPARVFVTGNYVFMNELSTNDNIMGVYPNIEYLSIYKNTLVSPREFAYELLYSHNVMKARDRVLRYAGAKRDSLDMALVESEKEIPILDGRRIKIAPKAMPKYTNCGEVINDNDGDGIPDEWEIKHGLNPLDNHDGHKLSVKNPKQTNLEIYMNELVAPTTKAEYRGHKINKASYLLFFRNLVSKVSH